MELTFSAYRRTDNQWDMARPHLHGEWELLFPLTDGDAIFIDNVSYPLRRGSLFLMEAGVPHRSRAHTQQEYHRCVLHFSTEDARALGLPELPLLSTGSCCAALSEEDFALCCRLFDRLVSTPDSASDHLRRTAAFAALLALVADKWSTPDPLPAPMATDPVITDAVTYIRSHLAEDLSLDALTERFYCSKSALCHRFKTTTGFTVTEYVILCRIRYAGTLLRRGLSVREAGDSAGFGDNAHFIRTFRRITGMTPGQYAKSHKE